MTADSTNAIKIFYCYAREDRALRDELEKHLGALKRSGRITTWYDREIQPGTEWECEIHARLDTADMVLLLISPDFMHSDYCWGVEMQRALERRKSGQAAVIPIIVRPVLWKGTPIGELQLLPTEGRAITLWPNRDAAFEDVASGVYEVVEALLHQKAEAERKRRAQEEQARQAEAERMKRIEQEQQARSAQAARGDQHSLALRLAAAFKTDVGKQLNRNEDCPYMHIEASEKGDRGLFIVADGMGQDMLLASDDDSLNNQDKYRAGDIASKLAVQKISEVLWRSFFAPLHEQPVIKLTPLQAVEPAVELISTQSVKQQETRKLRETPVSRSIESQLSQAIREANQALLLYGEQHPAARGLGCTITAALVDSDAAYIANVGDSRAYLLRDDTLRPLTKDHSLVAKLVEAGQIEPEDIYWHPQRHVIYRALGAGHKTIDVDVFHMTLRPGDRLLLCSDGLWEMVRHQELLKVLNAKRNLPQICDRLIDLANINGGEDNITAIVVQVGAS